MVKKSPEIEAFVVRWLEAHSRKVDRPLINMLSTSDHLRYLGSAPDEYWAGSLLRRGLANHLAEVPDWTASGVTVEGFEHGEAGWAIWQGQVNFEGRDVVLDVRFSFVLTLDDGVWHLVQVHCSMAKPNLEFSGMEHNTFSDLINAAMAGQDSVSGESSAVIMFTDVANSTEIANAVGDRDWAEAIGGQLEVQSSTVTQNDGTIVKTLGDGSMSSFDGARGAMRAAIAIQLAAFNSTAEPALQIRIGIHAGDVIQTEGDFIGTVVNKAARIAGLAKPQEVLVSDVVRAMTGERSSFKFSDPFSVALRGIEGQHSISCLHWDA